MAEIINLRLVRKQKDRDATRAKGIENAAKSGRSKALQSLVKARTDKANRELDGKQREGTSGHD